MSNPKSNRSEIERFSNRVANYAAYRPNYPSEILKLFRDEMNFDENAVVADIGSGTGISARLFLENGNRVFGIEPNRAMRTAAELVLRDFSNFKSINGTAENTTLANKSIDLIIAAQAFHWFDRKKVTAEFRRVLNDRGSVALIWNERQIETNEFLRDYEKFLLEFGTDYEIVRHEQINREVIENVFDREFRQAVFANSQTLDFEGLKGRMLSASYMPEGDHPRFGEMIKNLKALFAEHQKNGKIEVLYDTNIYYTQY